MWRQWVLWTVAVVTVSLAVIAMTVALAQLKRDPQKAGLVRLESAKDGVVCYALASETGVVHPGLSCLKVR